jgi:hypothetical protein
VQRLAHHHDGALAVRRDHHHVARVRRVPASGVHAKGPRASETFLDLPRALIVAQRGEEHHLGVRSRELEERHPSAASGKEARLLQVRNLARPRHGRHSPQRDVLHVADHRDPHASALYLARLHRGRSAPCSAAWISSTRCGP